VALLFTLFYAIAGSGLLGLLTNETQVIRAAGPYLPWAIAIPFAGLATFTWDGVFIGLTATRYMLISMSSAMLVFFSSYYLLSPYFANHALWLAFLLYLITRGAVQHLLYQKKILSLRNNPNLTLRQ
jgi:MATE family multidrug resistance protein